MHRAAQWSLMVALAAALACTPGAAAQEKPATSASAVHVLGLAGPARNTKGSLTLLPGTLRFDASQMHAEVPVASIQDVFTGDDSQRMVGGTLGALSMLAPYGGGRFLSLFRKKVDLLVIEYRDTSGGLHGAIFRVAYGQAAPFKRALVAGGAHASIPVEEEQAPKPPPEKKKGAKP